MKFAHILEDMRFMDPRTPVLISGKPGIGKTAWVKSLVKELGFESDAFVQMNLGQMADAADLCGVIKESQDGKTFFHMLHEAIAKAEAKPTVFFFDELNRANKELRNAAMQLCSWEQEFNGHKLAPGSRVIVAINPADVDSNDVENLNIPLLTRFYRANVELDLGEWTEWAHKADIDELIIQYINEVGLHALYNVAEEYGDEVDFNSGCPRSWEAFARCFHNANEAHYYDNGPVGLENLRRQATALLGREQGTNFKDWYSKNGAGITPKKILFAKDEKTIKGMMKKIQRLNGIERQSLARGIADIIKNAVMDKTPDAELNCYNFKLWFMGIEPELRSDFYATYWKPICDGQQQVNWMKPIFSYLKAPHKGELSKEVERLITTSDDNLLS